jgi:hypothetical protein
MTSVIHAAGLVDQGERLQTRRGERCLIRVAAAEKNGANSAVSHPDEGTPLYEGHCETGDHLHRGIAVRPLGRPIAGSALVRRLVLAKDDPAKQRIRTWLSDIDDERLFCLGLKSEDIAALRGTANPPAEAAIAQG